MKKKLKALTGLFTVHFEIDDHTHDILNMIAQYRGESANTVARKVLVGWLADTWTRIEPRAPLLRE